MKNSLFVIAICLICMPLLASKNLPAGSDLSFAISYYDKHVVNGIACPSTVAINARNKSAILQAAIPQYKKNLNQHNPTLFSDFFSASVNRSDRCQSPLVGLPNSLLPELIRATKIPTTTPNNCPDLSQTQKQAFELYLEAVAAKVVWDLINQHC